MSDRFPQLSGNTLKLIAAAAMLTDHVGLMFFPANPVFRIIGRLAFPIFAFMIAEGCRYTRSKLRYFRNLFVLALLCQIVYFIADGSMYLSVLFTFSLSVLGIYALQFCQEQKTTLSFGLFAAAIAGIYALNQIFTIDYGFSGCMVPIFASLPRKGSHHQRIASLGLGLLLLSMNAGTLQYFCLAAIPVLLCYSGKRGKGNLKYFFYIFYPAHLAILQILAWLTA